MSRSGMSILCVTSLPFQFLALLSFIYIYFTFGLCCKFVSVLLCCVTLSVNFMAQPFGVRMGIEPGTTLTGADEEMP